MAEIEAIQNAEQDKTVTEVEKQQTVDNFKHRLERAKEQGAKQVLNELGVTSTDEIKALLKKLEETTKNYEEAQKIAGRAKSAEQKLEVLKMGFDEKYADFIVHELRESKDFVDDLSKFKNENPHFLKNQNPGIKISTSPNFEKKNEIADLSKQFNELILKNLNKE